MREWLSVKKVINDELNSDLALAVGILIDRCAQGPIHEVRSDLSKEVGRDNLDFARLSRYLDSPADRNTIDGTDVDAAKILLFS